MSKHLFDYPIKEPWREYPWLFKPHISKTLLALVTMVCSTAVLTSFSGIPKDAEMNNPAFEKIPVPIAVTSIILIVLPVICAILGLLLAFIPVKNVPYKVKAMTFFLVTLLLIESYGLKDLIAATIDGW